MPVLPEDLTSAHDCAWRLLCYARDAEDARLLLSQCFPGDEIRPLLDALRENRSWTLERVKAAVMRRAGTGKAFSANWFYITLSEDAWPLIGPALQSLRHKNFDTIGTEIAINPARKMSRVTVYRLKGVPDELPALLRIPPRARSASSS